MFEGRGAGTLLAKVTSVTVREIDITDELTLERLRIRLPLEEYFFQRPQATLPRLIEQDYADPFFWHWCRDRLEQAGFQHRETLFGYVVVDIELEPTSGKAPTLSFPFMVASVFSYKGFRFAGPFVAGHQAGLSMIQSLFEQRYARYYLPPMHSTVFSSRWQAYVIARSIMGITDSGRVDGLVAALPSRGRPSSTYSRSPIARLLCGGLLTDVVLNEGAARDREAGPLSKTPGRAFQLTPLLFMRQGTPPPRYFDDFVYYSFLTDSMHQRFMSEDRFLVSLDLIRRLGPMFKIENPGNTEGVLFDPKPNLEIMKALIEFCAGWRHA